MKKMRAAKGLGTLVLLLLAGACGSSGSSNGGESPTSSGNGNGTGSGGETNSSTSSGTGSGGSGDTTSSGEASSGSASSSSASSSSASSSSASSSSASSSSASSSSSGSSSSSSSSSSSAGDAGAACRPQFASGVNVAWFNYASDVPNPNITKFTSLYTNVYNAGGRIVRWWFHTNGAVTPGYGTNGQATAISAANIADVKKILDAAYSAGVAVNISLWAFDMLSGGQSAPVADNLNLLTNDTDRQAYITNVLTPLVMALKGYHGLYSWEIFNEPEGMTTQNGWTTGNGAPAGGQEVDESVIQKTTNWFAAAIHEADPSALVTVGAWTFLANSPAVGTNYYSDANLIAAGGKTNGTLDYYQVHYYDNWGSPDGADKVNPFHYALSHWDIGDNKPVVIGEFWDIDTYANGSAPADVIKSANLYTTLYTNGYSGAWAWQYANADNPGPADYPTNSEMTSWGTLMQTSIQNLYNAHESAVVCN